MILPAQAGVPSGIDASAFSMEPLATALLLTTFGILLGVSVLFSRASERFGIPTVLIFLGIGILAGSDGLGAPCDQATPERQQGGLRSAFAV